MPARKKRAKKKVVTLVQAKYIYLRSLGHAKKIQLMIAAVKTFLNDFVYHCQQFCLASEQCRIKMCVRGIQKKHNKKNECKIMVGLSKYCFILSSNYQLYVKYITVHGFFFAFYCFYVRAERNKLQLST